MQVERLKRKDEAAFFASLKRLGIRFARDAENSDFAGKNNADLHGYFAH